MAKNDKQKQNFKPSLLENPDLSLGKDSKYKKMYNSEATRDLMLSVSKTNTNITLDKVFNNPKQVEGQRHIFELVGVSNDELKAFKLRPRETQVLSLYLEEFTKTAPKTTKELNRSNLEVTIDVENTARRLGFNVDDVKKGKDELNNGRKRIKEAVSNIGYIKFDAQIDGTVKAIEFLQEFDKRVRQGKLTVMFSHRFAEYLIKMGQINYLDDNLLKIPDTDPNAYKLGQIINQRWTTMSYRDKSNPKPIKARDRLKIKNILPKLDITSYEQITKSRGSWQQKIRAPFENALNGLIDKYGVVNSWDYGKPNGELLEDEQHRDIESYREWEELLIYFEKDFLEFEEKANNQETKKSIE